MRKKSVPLQDCAPGECVLLINTKVLALVIQYGGSDFRIGIGTHLSGWKKIFPKSYSSMSEAVNEVQRMGFGGYRSKSTHRRTWREHRFDVQVRDWLKTYRKAGCG